MKFARSLVSGNQNIAIIKPNFHRAVFGRQRPAINDQFYFASDRSQEVVVSSSAKRLRSRAPKILRNVETAHVQVWSQVAGDQKLPCGDSALREEF